MTSKKVVAWGRLHIWLLLVIFCAYCDEMTGLVFMTVMTGMTCSIPCVFEGRVAGVDWKRSRASSPSPSYESIVYVDNNFDVGYKGGPGLAEGRFDMRVEEPIYDLIIQKVELQDTGRYMCEIMNLNGTAVRYFTAITVLDESEYEISTLPKLTKWKGETAKLQCAFRETAIDVTWIKVTDKGTVTINGTQKYDRNGGYKLELNHTLSIDDLKVKDEGQYICEVKKTEDLQLRNSTFLIVNNLADSPYLRISGCENSSPDGCTVNFRTWNDRLDVTCGVLGAKPEVTISWFDTSANINVTETSINSSTRPDGTLDTASTMTLLRHWVDYVQCTLYKCTATGIAVGGTVERELYTCPRESEEYWLYVTMCIIDGVMQIISIFAVVILVRRTCIGDPRKHFFYGFTIMFQIATLGVALMSVIESREEQRSPQLWKGWLVLPVLVSLMSVVNIILNMIMLMFILSTKDTKTRPVLNEDHVLHEEKGDPEYAVQKKDPGDSAEWTVQNRSPGDPAECTVQNGSPGDPAECTAEMEMRSVGDKREEHDITESTPFV